MLEGRDSKQSIGAGAEGKAYGALDRGIKVERGEPKDTNEMNDNF